MESGTGPFSEELLKAYAAIGTASVCDALQSIGIRGYASSAIGRLVGAARIAGPAITVQEVPSQGAGPPIHALTAIEEAASGSIVVIANGGELDVAVWGGLMTAGAVARGLKGVVTDSAVRDLEEIERDYDFAVFAQRSSPATTLGRFRTLGSGAPVAIGGLTVNQGDLVVGDRDGVVVVPQLEVDRVLKLAQGIEEKEAAQTKLIRESGSLATGLAMFDRI